MHTEIFNTMTLRLCEKKPGIGNSKVPVTVSLFMAVHHVAMILCPMEKDRRRDFHVTIMLIINGNNSFSLCSGDIARELSLSKKNFEK